jgi:hypothetical protein
MNRFPRSTYYFDRTPILLGPWEFRILDDSAQIFLTATVRNAYATLTSCRRGKGRAFAVSV